MGLAMNGDDLMEVVAYFKAEGRDPNETELRILDTYWSDHCRHTTFTTLLTDIAVEDSFFSDELKETLSMWKEMRRELGREKKPLCLMDLATIGARWLRANGKLDDLEGERGKQCLLHLRGCGRGRQAREMAAAVQERDPQPPHGDRAVRRSVHLSGRSHPRPAERPQLRLPGDARDRSGRHHTERERHAARQSFRSV